MISTSGSRLLTDDATQAIYTDLLPSTHILTPNIPETLYLLKLPEGSIKSVSDMKNAAVALAKLGPRFVLIKGGHNPMMKDGSQISDGDNGEIVVDVLYNSEREIFEVIQKAFIISKHTHGTGCSLASAIASNLARGLDTVDAVKEASKYIAWAIETAPGFGKGNGPINHLHSLKISPFAP